MKVKVFSGSEEMKKSISSLTIFSHEKETSLKRSQDRQLKCT
jgi:hypothetical protein